MTVHRKNTLFIGLILITAISFFLSTLQIAWSQSYSEAIAIGEISTRGGEITYYTFSVPGEAVNPRLVGNYQVQDGDTMKVNILDQEGCPTPLSPFDCTSVYSTPDQDRGDMNVALTPGKTYYLEFDNDSWFSSKTTNVDIHLEYD